MTNIDDKKLIKNGILSKECKDKKEWKSKYLH